MKRAKLSEVLLQRRGLKGDAYGCNGEKGECVPPVSVVRRQYGRIAKAEKERRLGVLLQCRLLLTDGRWLQRSKWKDESLEPSEWMRGGRSKRLEKT